MRTMDGDARYKEREELIEKLLIDKRAARGDATTAPVTDAGEAADTVSEEIEFEEGERPEWGSEPSSPAHATPPGTCNMHIGLPV